jgi:exonuclease VII small subunit
MDLKELKNKIEKEGELGLKKKEKINNQEEKLKQLEKAQEQPISPEATKEIQGGLESKGSSEIRGMSMASASAQKLKNREKEIEKILEEGLSEIYLDLPPAKQREFRILGEKTAREINLLLEKAKLKIRKIIELIRRWLLIVPGVNKFFLEQEVKIRADKIIRLKK